MIHPLESLVGVPPATAAILLLHPAGCVVLEAGLGAGLLPPPPLFIPFLKAMHPFGIATFGPATGHTATPTFLQTVLFVAKSNEQVIVPTNS